MFLILAALQRGRKARLPPPRACRRISETVRYVSAAANAYYDFAGALNVHMRPPPDDAERSDSPTPPTSSSQFRRPEMDRRVRSLRRTGEVNP